MARSDRYSVAVLKSGGPSPKQVYLLSNTNTKIVKALLALKSRSKSYAHLAKTTGAPLNSLYTFCQRLDEAGIIKRTRLLGQGPNRRMEVVITLVKELEFPKTEIVR